MSGFLSRTIGLILAFLILIAVILNVYGVKEMEDRTQILNEVSFFLDKATDKGIITDNDLDEFYMTIESHGMVLDVKVNRLVKTATLLENNTISTTYISADDISVLNQRDILQIELKERSTTPYKKLMSFFLRVNQPIYSLTLAKMVK